jgi:hypothetical protein
VTICWLKETHLTHKQTMAEDARMEDDLSTWWPQKTSGVATLILDKVDFKCNSVTKDKEGHSILIKGTIHQEEIKIVNLYIARLVHPTSLNIQYWTLKHRKIPMKW